MLGPLLIVNRVILQDDQPAKDDIYDVPNLGQSFQTKEGVVTRVWQYKQYTLPDNKTLIIRYGLHSEKGGDMLINNQVAPDGKYKVGFSKSIVVKNGKVV